MIKKLFRRAGRFWHPCRRDDTGCALPRRVAFATKGSSRHLLLIVTGRGGPPLGDHPAGVANLTQYVAFAGNTLEHGGMDVRFRGCAGITYGGAEEAAVNGLA